MPVTTLTSASRPAEFVDDLVLALALAGAA